MGKYEKRVPLTLYLKKSDMGRLDNLLRGLDQSRSGYARAVLLEYMKREEGKGEKKMMGFIPGPMVDAEDEGDENGAV